MKGICKWFDDKKGYGFITSDTDHKDFFVHQTQIQMKGYRTLFEEQPVEFDAGKDEHGRALATNVRKISE